MHPLLLRISLGGFEVPLVVAVAAAALLGVATLSLGVLARRRAVLFLGGALCVVALGFAVRGPSAPVPARSLDVTSFGAASALAVGLGWALTRVEARRFAVEREALDWVLLAAVVSALVGARVLFVATVHGAPWRSVMDLGGGGLSGAGAWLGGLFGAWLAARRWNVGYLRVLDAAAPALAFAIVCVRLGCFLQGCDYGPVLGDSAPSFLQKAGTLGRWPVELGLGAGPPLLLEQIQGSVVELGAAFTAPAHPTPLYEALVGLGLLAGLALLSRRRRFVGQAGLAVVAGYALFTAALSPLVVGAERSAFTPWLFVGLGLAAGFLWLERWWRFREASAAL